MKPVLYVTGVFPPTVSAGVFRLLRFLKHLESEGFSSVVLTVEAVAREGAPVDKSLSERVPDGMPVVRTRLLDLRRLRAILERLRIFRFFWFLFYPIFWERYALWFLTAVPRGLRLIRSHEIELIFTTSGPFSSLLIGWLLKTISGRPWVAELRDPYSFGYMWVWPTRLHHRISSAVEIFLLRRADRVIVVTPTMKEIYHRDFGVPEDRIQVVTNGFDDEVIGTLPTRDPVPGVLTFCYGGSLDGMETAGGRGRWGEMLDYRIDHLVDRTTRTGVYFLEAVRRVVEDGRVPREGIRVRFFGRIAPGYVRLVERMGLSDVVEIEGYKDHYTALQAMRNADVLLLPLESATGAYRSPYATGKIYEYMVLQRPVLILGDRSDAIDLFEPTGMAYRAGPRDADAIADAIARIHRDQEDGRVQSAPAWEYVERFSGRALTRQLADSWREVLENEKFGESPGAARTIVERNR